MVSYENAPVGKNAWVGIYKDSQHPGNSDPSYAWQYTSAANGTLQFTISDAGSYFAVLFGDNGYTEISPRFPFVVGADRIKAMHDEQWEMNNTAIFNLAGQRVEKMNKGIYIYNDRKIIIK